MLNLKYELELIGKGLDHVAGVDEAGRGPLAGPIVAAAVILDPKIIIELSNLWKELKKYDSKTKDKHLSKKSYKNSYDKYAEIKDSKKLTEKIREDLYEFIIKEARDYSVARISSTEIDQEGIACANSRGFTIAVKSLRVSPDHVLSDHFRLEDISVESQTNISKGDNKSITIAAASIVAKVYRDRIMRKYADEFPQYGFEKHKGYGTKYHKEAILKHGPCAIHRKSFEPVKSMLIVK